MMNAVRSHKRGGAETLVSEQAPKPTPVSGEVLIEVHAAGITFHELLWDASWQDAKGQDRTPIVPAHEVSGVVAALGEGVTQFEVGDEVYGRIDFNRDGAAAEYVAVPTDDLALRPRTIGHVESAALPIAALTAWQALVDHADVKPGEHVLVLGGSGGVGVYAVQLAAHLGATVSATARGTDLQLVVDLGADLVLDYRNATEENVLSPADVIIDTVGGGALARAADLVAPGGRLVTLGAPPSSELTEGRDFTATFFVVESKHEQLAHLATLVDDGRLRPVVAQVYQLSEGRAAYEDGPLQGKAGKTVIEVKS